MFEAAFNQVSHKLLVANNILLISHKKPDGDACGAILSLLIYLRDLGKNTGAFVADGPPSYFDFLPFIEELKNDRSVLEQQWEVAIVLDSGDWDYTGFDRRLLNSAFIINLDHHWSNHHFGDINLVDNRASSTCEMIYHFFEAVGAPLNRRIATCLLNGILTDTSGFTNAATTVASMRIASRLISQGAKIHHITNKVVRNKSIDGLRLWGLILSRFKINKKFDLAYTYIKEEEFKKYKVAEEEIDGFVNFLNIIADVSLVMFLRLNHQDVKVSLRTNQDEIDLARLAALFGGGGHKKAAGFSVPWQLVEREGELEVI